MHSRLPAAAADASDIAVDAGPESLGDINAPWRKAIGQPAIIGPATDSETAGAPIPDAAALPSAPPSPIG